MLVLERSVLTEKIARRGFHLSREYNVDPLEILFVGEVMQRDVRAFVGDVTAGAALTAISGHDPAELVGRRQMLYPVLDVDGRLLGVVTRTALETVVHDGESGLTLGRLCIPATVTHPDETLRAAAMTMAANDIDRLPVVDRNNPDIVLGMVSLTMLLAGRVRDHHEEHAAQRILRLPTIRPSRVEVGATA
ncbi:CBS domain-containing protein [Nocardia sp. CA-151230]|uniref:CBS domain-containing protein n=1 Tax=Nocardia sp. CA-151230 TaxID=3239982 RepID=UPI003D937E59